MIRINHRKARRLIQEGEVARAGVLPHPGTYIDARTSYEHGLRHIYRAVGRSDLELDDIAQFSDDALAKLGLRRADVRAVLDERADLAELRERLDRARAEALPKQRLAARIVKFLSDNAGAIA
jgi:hypothetical protein